MFGRLFTTILLMILALKGYSQITFKGGQVALDRYLSNNIVYPEYARQNCIAATIKVKFHVDSIGNVSKIAIQDGLGIDLDDEAMRVVRMTSGRWLVPAGQNYGDNLILPVRFNPDNTRCGNISTTDMQAAIANYKAQEALQNAVTNYYKNKLTGKADPAGEPEIIALKKQLGYDDDFIADMLNQAGKKLKQGDKAGACEDWNFIRNIGSDKADGNLAKYCK